VRVLAVLMLVWEPLGLALTASAALPRLALYGFPAYVLLGARLAVAGLGLAAGRALWVGRPEGDRLARWWLAAATLAGVLTLLTPYFAVNRLPGTRGPLLAFLLAWNGGWFLYLAARRNQSRPDAPVA
jgi:hypothetical protein